ncbi:MULTISPECIES: polyphosphate kinase 1 [Sphingobacterium]|jgi:polyphosphate kinase|uniref:Polyphosphate kinase n=1 Tax=Sphingobacterium kitahiroshimense TaxID=470446 RepID=A0ABV0BZT2_9SPHI|nr:MULTISPECIES: polyphosphate kinase 1 [Sphingobacterium]MCW2263533.1 polyphosphate kinase [Sphingobacterium kitahiroshimense]TCR05967.1 polyphosphate kinase [Sphingobacterium sp. JUb78]
MARKFIPRDVSWLSFNSRVLQEAADETVPLPSKIKFLGIFSNNLDEFFRVRIPGLKRAIDIKDKEANTSFFEDPQIILDEVNTIVIKQQKKFDNFWALIQKEMAQQHVYIKDASQLNLKQEEFVRNFYSEDVESNVIPLLLDDSRPMPYLRDKSLYLGISMRKQEWEYETKFAIIEIPTTLNGRFVILPASAKEKHIILLEDIIKFNLPYIFSYFGFDEFHAHVFKITKDAEFDIDNDINTTLAEKISKGIKNRRKGKTTRFIFDKEMDPRLVEFLIKKLQLTKKDNIIPGQKIHNFKHFMDFPNVFKQPNLPITNPAFTHPQLNKTQRITDIIIKKDILLSFPYHTFRPVIDLLREAAMDPDVKTIQITAYRLASNSKIVNALINAARNGKDVTVMLELQARFDEENNLFWKEKLELEGIRVLTGVPNKKVHAKLCIIKKRVGAKTIQYGFVSTGNINEKTAKLYGDYCLLTSNRSVMADINKVFHFLKKPKSNPAEVIKNCNSLLICPTDMRNGIIHYIDKEIEEVKAGRKARIILKVNSLSDRILIKKLYDAAEAGVQLDLIVRGIYCATNQTKFKKAINAISIVDEFLEHARVMYFYAAGKEVTYISSADWMTRNLDHRIEAAVKINSKKIRDEIKDMLQIQLRDNVKARILNNELNNRYVENDKESCRSQIEIYNYLRKKTDEV